MNILNCCKNFIWVIVLAALTVYLSPAHAHLKWFTDDSEKQIHLYNDVVSYSLAWVGIGVVLIFIGIFIDKIFPRISASWQPTLIEKYSTSILGIFVGISLIISSLNGYLFSMNIKDVGTLHTVLLLCEGFIGLSLVFGLAVRQASIVLIVLWLIATQTAGLVVTLENFWILGAAIFFLLQGRPLLRYSREDIFSFLDNGVSQAQALTFLRVFIGANLIFLGFSEKILVPELGLAFLQEHQWNFMQHIGLLWFSDELFVFSAGAVEIILGVFLIAGWVVRLTAAILVVLFLTPPFFMGPAEMIGHIPHLSILTMLLLFGRGHTFRVAFTALIAMSKHVKTLPADALQNQQQVNTTPSNIDGASPPPLLPNLYNNGAYQKTGFVATLSRTHGALSSLSGHDMKNRYKRTPSFSETERHYSISRLSRKKGARLLY